MEEILNQPDGGAAEKAAHGREKPPAFGDMGWRWINPVTFLLVSLVVGFLAVLGTVYTTGYVVTVDGEVIGAMWSEEEFEQTAARVEARVGAILGEDYTLVREVTYESKLMERDGFTPVEEIEAFLFNGVEEIIPCYVLRVDGEVIGGAAEKAALTSLLDGITAPYTTEYTHTAGFTVPVTVEYEYAPADINQDTAEMAGILTANTNGQTVYEIQAGDTFMQIAFDNDMTVRELRELNPDVSNIDVIYIGQLLNVREEIPFLSVRTVEQVTYHQPVECPVEEVPDSSMYQGESVVLDAGVEGDSLVTADVTYVNGKEQERNVLTSTILSEPTTKVMAVGTKVRPTWYPNGYFIWPVYGTVSSTFGYRYIFGSTSYHGGLDIAAPYGTGIAAADGGTVTFAGTATGISWSYGNLVIIDHGDGRVTYYGHCSRVLVSAGDRVAQGQTIARVGSTGRSTGNHCHFEVRINGTQVNPRSYLP